MKKSLIIIFLIISIISLEIYHVAISNKFSTEGIELESIQGQIAQYHKQNTLLQEKILEAEALTNLSKKAEQLGFVESKKQIYLTEPLPLALNQ